MILETIEIPPKSPHTRSVIWMHGLGANGHDFEGIVPELHLPDDLGIHFVFPNAPIQRVTINGGMKMRSWYDVLDLSVSRAVNMADIYKSSKGIHLLIQKEMDKGILPKNILLAGFSQGGVLALHTGLRFSHALAGILALSTYLPTLPMLKTEQSVCNKNIPIMMAHGSFDPVIPIESAKETYEKLAEMNYPIEWHEYPMEHSLCMEEILRISTFIQSVFK
jgi:phospholipase/carboxylesterase